MNDFLQKAMFIFLSLGVVVCVSIVITLSIPKQQTLRENYAQREVLQAEVEQIREQITQTKRNIDRFKSSPYFVERLARMNHRVADNEIVFIFQ